MASEDQPLGLKFANGEDSLEVRRFCIDEGLSRLFSVSVVAVSPKPDIEFEDIVGHNAGFRLTVTTKESRVWTPVSRVWSGVCNHFELLQPEIGQPGAQTKGLSTYFLRIVPLMWLTTQRRNHRVFQQKTIPQIVQQEILDPWSIDGRWELRKERVELLSGNGDESIYRKHDYIVQYGETDFDFVSRLLERAGISFYFRFEEQNPSALIFDDVPHAGDIRPGAPIPCFDVPPSKAPPEYVHHVRVAHTVQPGAVTLRDYEFRRAYNQQLVRDAEDHDGAPENFCEQYRYEPGRALVDVKTPGSPATPAADDKGIYPRHDELELKWQAQRELESLRKNKRHIRYETNAPDLAPGICFSINGHPRDEISPGNHNVDPTFLVAETHLEGTAVGALNWSFGGKALFTTAPYVPDMVTPKPLIYGMQSATVVGPKGEEIHTDEYGRVRVRFHWDPNGAFDDSNSCWLRVSQDWAGAGFGTVMLPRIGQEVLVGFYEGDPDQPIVLGRVYNEIAKVPYKLPKHKTRSTWKSDSTPKADGFNEIMFEDQADKELVYVQAQRDLQKLVKKFETERIKDERVTFVGKEQTTVVGELDSRMVGERYLVQMIPPTNADEMAIQPQEDFQPKPKPTTVEMKNERIIFTTGKATVAFDGKDIRLEAKGDITIHAEKSDVIVEGKHVYVNTQAPSPAPKPDPFVPLTPGTFAAIVPPQTPDLEALEDEEFAFDPEADAIPQDPEVPEAVEPTPCDIREAVVLASLPVSPPQTFGNDFQKGWGRIRKFLGDPSHGPLQEKPKTRQVKFPGADEPCREKLKKKISAYDTTLEVIAVPGGAKVPITIQVRYVGSCAYGKHPEIRVQPDSKAAHIRETLPAGQEQGAVVIYKKASVTFDVWHEKRRLDKLEDRLGFAPPAKGLLGFIGQFFRVGRVATVKVLTASCGNDEPKIPRTSHLVRVYQEETYGISVSMPAWHINCEANNTGDLSMDDFNVVKKSSSADQAELAKMGVDARLKATPTKYGTFGMLANGADEGSRMFLPAIVLTANGEEYNVTAAIRRKQEWAAAPAANIERLRQGFLEIPKIIKSIEECMSLGKRLPQIGWIIDFEVKFLEGSIGGQWGTRIAKEPGSSGSCRYSLVEWYAEFAVGLTLVDFTLSVGWGFEVEGPFISDKFCRIRSYEFVAKVAGDINLKIGGEGKWCITDGEKEIVALVEASLDLYVTVVAQVFGHGLHLRAGIVGGVGGEAKWQFGPAKPVDFSARIFNKEVYFYACWRSKSGMENPDFRRTLMREGRWLNWRHT